MVQGNVSCNIVRRPGSRLNSGQRLAVGDMRQVRVYVSGVCVCVWADCARPMVAVLLQAYVLFVPRIVSESRQSGRQRDTEVVWPRGFLWIEREGKRCNGGGGGGAGGAGIAARR